MGQVPYSMFSILHEWDEYRTVCSWDEYHTVCSVSYLNRMSFVCVEVLRPSQPNGVMSSAVSLPNHTFTGQDPLSG